MSSRRTQGEKKLYPIGELMEEFGVTNRALRLYEERGLLKPIRVSKARVYSSQDRDRLATILEGKALGLTITEIAEALASGGDDLRLSIEQIDAQLEYLKRQRVELDSAIAKLQAQRSGIVQSPGWRG
jgi:DNA-binding transcriptional MerR regulator